MREREREREREIFVSFLSLFFLFFFFFFFLVLFISYCWVVFCLFVWLGVVLGLFFYVCFLLLFCLVIIIGKTRQHNPPTGTKPYKYASAVLSERIRSRTSSPGLWRTADTAPSFARCDSLAALPRSPRWKVAAAGTFCTTPGNMMRRECSFITEE